MSPSDSDTASNLLLGVLGLQNGLLTPDELVAATRDWLADKSRSLENVLVDRGMLDDDERQLLTALARKLLSQHGDDAEESLRMLSTLGSAVRDQLQQLNDDAVNHTIALVSIDRHAKTLNPVDTATAGAAGETPAGSSIAGPRFRVVRPHARGNLGQVSVAIDQELNREVAFKELLDAHAHDDWKRARFLVEAQITGGLEHPGIVPIYGLGHYGDGRPFYAMRFVRGDSLKEAIEAFHRQRAKLDPGERRLKLRALLARFIDVCEAVAYAHSRGVLHRDLKPGNIMLGKYGETLVVDWGLAKAQREPQKLGSEGPVSASESAHLDETLSGSVVGTPSFMPPEQAAGELERLCPASDVYSLGATLYCLLTGKPPIESGTLDQVLQRVRQGEFPPPRAVLAEVPKALESICLKAMARAPEHRYQNTKALADDVEHWLADEPVAAHAETAAERALRWMRRHRSWTLAGTAALVTVAVVSVASTLVVNAAWRNEAEARLQESHLRQLAEQSREFDVRLLESRQLPGGLTPDQLDQLDRQLDALNRIPAAEAAEQVALRRNQLQTAYLAGISAALDKSPFEDADLAAFNQRLAALERVFGRRDPNLGVVLRDLENRRDARLAQWDPMFDLERPINDLAFFTAGLVEPNDYGGLRRLAGSGANLWVVSQARCPIDNVELLATFDQTWQTASAIGISVNHSDAHRYDFVVAVDGFSSTDLGPRDLDRLPAMGDVLKRVDNRQLYQLVLRDGQVLRRVAITPEVGPMRLLARREGNRLLFSVNDAAGLEMADPFALPRNPEARFALYWPAGPNLERLLARRRRTPQSTTPMERGDELYAQGLMADAMNLYRGIAGSAEARYKTGMCQYWLGDTAGYMATMLEVADNAPREETQWRLLAQARLLQQHSLDQNRELFRERLKVMLGEFDLRDTAQLLPAAERRTLLEDIRRSGQRTRVAIQPQGDIEDLTLAVELDGIFNEDLPQRRATQWRLADAYRVAAVIENNPNHYTQAEAILRGLIEDAPGEAPVPARERTALVADLCWMLAEQNNLPPALAEVNRWLLDAEGKPRREYLPLLVSRARIAYVEGDSKAAARDLDDFLRLVDVREISHDEYGAACLLRGMIHEDAGDLTKARAIWLEGSYRNWHAGPPAAAEIASAHGAAMAHLSASFDYDSLVSSWTNELTADEAYRRMLRFTSGQGMGSIAVEKFVRTAMPAEFVRAVSLGVYQSEAGRELGRATVLRNRSLRETVLDGAREILFSGVVQAAYADLETTPDELALTREECGEMVRLYDDLTMDDRDMLTVLELWQGRGSRRDWGKLRDRLPPRLAASLGYIVGRLQLARGQTAAAEQYFEEAAANPEVHYLVRERIRQELDKLRGANKPAS